MNRGNDAVLVLVLALGVNFGAASFIHGPGYLDDSYYYGGALQLARGQGFSEPYLWNYLGQPTSLPRPSHLYWMPLTSILAAASMRLFGESFAAARLPSVIAASVLPLIAYRTAAGATGLRRHGLAAALLTIFSGFYAAFWGTTDSFAIYALAGSATLLALHRAEQTGRWVWWFGAGVSAGVAHLTRADGILLLAVILLFAARRWKESSVGLRAWLPVGGYLLVMLPWFVRNEMAAGSPLGVGGANTLWLVEYNDLFNYPAVLSAERYWAAGWGVIAQGKWQALVSNLQTIIAVQGLVFLAPFIALGLWKLRANGVFRPAILYAGLLYFFMTAVFSFPGSRGGLFHSSAALLPFYSGAALAGIDSAIDWVARRRPRWRADQAKAGYTLMAVLLAAVLTLGILFVRLKDWDADQTRLASFRSALPAAAVVMSNNPPGLWVAAGHPGVIVPNGNVQTLLAAADQFGVRYVLLDANYPPALAELYGSGKGHRLKLIHQWGEWKLFEVLPN